ncbi:MAG: hypothetical protein LBM73_03030 [Candidatus Nomurabacteria bacterium]|nr:hypothetical protein [Candidatus Nomurabacteria bacterium]
MEFLKSVRRRGVIPQVFHILFNLIYVALLVGLVAVFGDTPWPAIVLVLISKWRVIAVRPRYWLTNLRANLVDLNLGLGVALILWSVGASEPILLGVIGVLYAAWLIFLKPRGGRLAVVLQSGISQLIGLWALLSIGHLLWLPLVVILAFAVGYGAAWHILADSEEKDSRLLALCWGLVVGELGFVAWHWTIGYQIVANLALPQMALIVTAIGFVVWQAYQSYRKRGRVKWADIQWPLLFAAALILLLTLGFGGLFDSSQLQFS